MRCPALEAALHAQPIIWHFAVPFGCPFSFAYAVHMCTPVGGRAPSVLLGASPCSPWEPPPMILAAVFSQSSKGQQKGDFCGKRPISFGFYDPKLGKGGPPAQPLSKKIKNLEIWPILRYFCLLWAGPAEQCCTPVYPLRQKLPFCWDSLAPKIWMGGSTHPNVLPNHQKPWNSAYFGVLLSVVRRCYRTVLHTSVPVSYTIGTKIP